MCRVALPDSKSTRGFTLIELLVVIAIISILAAILFPVFATAREKARQTTCASNEKQLALAMLQYMQDNDEVYDVPIHQNTVGWAGPLYPYVKSAKTYTCPDENSPVGNGASGNNVEVSYAENSNLFSDTIGNYYPLNQSKLTATSLTVLYFEVGNKLANVANLTETASTTGDAGNGTGGSLQYFTGQPLNNQPWWECGYLGNPVRSGLVNVDPNYPNGRHSNGSNFAFCDGHVKWLPPGKISPGVTPYVLGCAQDTNNHTCEKWLGNGNAASTDMLAAGGFTGTSSTL